MAPRCGAPGRAGWRFGLEPSRRRGARARSRSSGRCRPELLGGGLRVRRSGRADRPDGGSAARPALGGGVVASSSRYRTRQPRAVVSGRLPGGWRSTIPTGVCADAMAEAPVERWCVRDRRTKVGRCCRVLARAEGPSNSVVNGVMPPIEATVAIVARDEERLIGGAVRSALAQGAGVEVLVIDDHSTDRTAMIAAHAGARVLTNSGSGLVDARNTAIAAAAADIIMWLDADDRLEPSALAVVLRRFADPGVALVAGAATFVDERGRQLTRQSAPPDTVRCRIVALAFNPFNHSAVAIRRGPILELGGYRRGIETEAAEDYDLWARLLAEDRVIIGLSTSVVTMEVRKNSESVRSSEAQARRGASDSARTSGRTATSSCRRGRRLDGWDGSSRSTGTWRLLSTPMRSG